MYNSTILLGIIVATTLMLYPFLLVGLEEASAKNYVKDAKKQLKEAEEWADCTNKNAEKTMFYLNQDPPKFYHENLFCDPSEQYKYDRLNQLAGIDEYVDAHNFLLSNENYFQVDNEDDDNDNDDKKDKKDKKDKDDD
ncbi:MAG TPA: hypothetical protein VKA95_12735 [Nitrososphaeraceae archaeon]|nr:hypothetical protein [Nitrososphaeraceae archaeon]